MPKLLFVKASPHKNSTFHILRILTDTPDIAFDKVSMVIVGSLLITKRTLVYTHIQDLLTKYSVAMLKQATSSEISVHKKVYQPVLIRAESMGYRSQFHKQCDASYST